MQMQLDKAALAALLAASAAGEEMMTKKLLHEDGVPAHCKDAQGWTPLMRASSGGHKSVVNLLLTAPYPANTNSQNRFGKTALHYACANGHGLIARILLLYGADPKQRDNSGRTAFDDAIDNGHKAVVADLIAKLPGASLPPRLEPPVLYRADTTTLSVTWDQAVAAPSALSHTTTATATAADGSSTASAGTAASPAALSISCYRLQVASAAHAPALRRWTLIASDITGSTYRVKGLSPASNYVLRLAACNEYGWGEYSDASDVMSTAALPPGAAPAPAAADGDGALSATAAVAAFASMTAAQAAATQAAANAAAVANGASAASLSVGFWGAGTASQKPSSGSSVSLPPIAPAGPPGTGAAAAAAAVAPSASSTTSKSGKGHSNSRSADPSPTASTRDTSHSSRHHGSSGVDDSGGGSGGGSGGPYADSEEARELRELLQTMQLDLEEEQGKRRVMEAELARYTAAPSALAAMSVEELTGLESALEASVRQVRGVKERKMKEALGDEMNRTLCSVCLVNPKTILFLPCKHLCACAECAGRIMRPGGGGGGGGDKKEPQCPICRKPVAQILDVYA